MADGQFGGNGSVHWAIRADEGNAGSGIDYAGNRPGRGTHFVVRIKLPESEPNWLADLRQLEPVNGVLEFELPIANDPTTPETQIQVYWGRVPPDIANRLRAAKGKPA